jgi:crossover junction endodeoxyribonuclease RuvC
MKILGIDPGYDKCGFSVIEGEVGKEKLLYSTCVKTSPKDSFSKRLFEVATKEKELIQQFSPTHLAIESLFFTNNQKTAMRVAEVRGVLMYLAQERGLSVYEFNPLQVKTSILGSGRADKKQMEFMVKKIIKIDKKIEEDDEFDAIAIALTFSANSRSLDLNKQKAI